MKIVNGVAVWSEIDEIVAPSHTALLIVDMQNDTVLPDGWFAKNGKDVSRVSSVIAPTKQLIELGRRSGVLTIFIEQTTLEQNRSDPPAWLYFKTRDGRQATDYTLDGTWGQQTVSMLGARDDDLRIRKFRPSAFHETALCTLLQTRNVQTVLICGTITQGCVQATMMDASFHNFYAVLVEDCVQSYDQLLHENALTFMRSRYDVVSVADLTRIWTESGASGVAR